MTNLLTLSGKADVSGRDILTKIDPMQLDDVSAAMWGLKMLVRMNPDVTWGDLLADNFKLGAKWYERIGSMIGNGLSDAVNLIGKKGGETVRLVTDEKVQDTIGRAGAAYFTAGGSEGAAAIFGSLFNTSDQNGKILASGMGQNIKAGMGGIPVQFIWVGGGILAVVLLLTLSRPRSTA